MPVPFDAAAASVVRRYGEILEAGEPERAVRTSFAEHGEFHFMGNHRLSGSYVGHEAIIGFYENASQTVEMLGMEQLLELAGDGWVIEVRRVPVARSNDEYVFEELVGYRIEDGLISQLWITPLDPSGTDRFLQ